MAEILKQRGRTRGQFTRDREQAQSALESRLAAKQAKKRVGGKTQPRVAAAHFRTEWDIKRKGNRDLFFPIP
jgi:hypothetical protein